MDQLARELGISKAAVGQHLIALERDGLVARSELVKTRGRPSHLYVLTESGLHVFPKHYDWFARLLLEHYLKSFGSESTQKILYQLGQKLAENFSARLAGKKDNERLQEVVAIMSELGYEAELVADADPPFIRAFNCIYHHLAKENPEVCFLDLGLLDALLGRVEHRECMVRGGLCCAFCPLGSNTRRAFGCA